jgi:hypothetical protein
MRDVDVQELFLLWNSEMTNTELCEHFQITGGSLWSLRVKHKLPIRPRVVHRDTQRRPKDPTPEEIAERAAEQRARRCKEEQARMEKMGRTEWEMPAYAFNSRDFSYTRMHT